MSIKHLDSGARYVIFRVAGIPQPQGSKTVGRTSWGRTFVREDNPQIEPWRNAVAVAAFREMNGDDPLTGPLRLDVTFRFPRPKSHFRTGKRAGELRPSAPDYCAKRPDLDKLLRAVGDAITGVVLVDDAQIAELKAKKVYGSPSAWIAVSEIKGGT